MNRRGFFSGRLFSLNLLRAGIAWLPVNRRDPDDGKHRHPETQHKMSKIKKNILIGIIYIYINKASYNSNHSFIRASTKLIILNHWNSSIFITLHKIEANKSPI